MLWALLVLFQQGVASASQDEPRLQMGVSARPDTVTVGDHFVLTVRVRAPLGAAIAFPAGPDSGGVIEAIDPRVVRSNPDTTSVDQSATYRLVAWDTGRVAAPIDPVVVRLGDREHLLRLDSVRIIVRSVLPVDTSLHDPKPARDIVPGRRPWWHWLVAALIAVAIIGLLLWWWIRRRRRQVAVIPVNAFVRAEQEFERIEALRLIEAGERGRHVALCIEVLRDYLAARIGAARTSHTSSELLDTLRSRPEVPLERLQRVLEEADLIKFARRPVTAERASALGRESRQIVHHVEEQLEAAARAAAASAEAERAA
ncbi:MAG TPA: hypothetical protein VJ803_12220 [Gemmatimonadaceae bacterium]|nr:hypothetical protein [Gemmatimonadaceae bacterium]